MTPNLPGNVLDYPIGVLTALVQDERFLLVLREEQIGLRKYPQNCPFDVRMGCWDVDGALAVVVLARLARSDLTTYDTWIDAARPDGVRALQSLSVQSAVELFIVTIDHVRSLRVNNPMQLPARELVERIHNRRTWTPEQFTALQQRIGVLYPTRRDLWWACEELYPTWGTRVRHQRAPKE